MEADGNAQRPASPWVAPEAGSEQPGGDRHPPVATQRHARPEPAVRSPVPLRPMTASDMLDGAFRVIKLRPKRVLAAAAVVVVPPQIVLALGQGGLDRNPFAGWLGWGSLSVAGSSTVSSWRALAFLAGTLLSSLSLFFLGGVVTAFVTNWVMGRDITTRDALATSFRRGGPFMGAWAILLLPKLLAAAMCYLPLLFFVALVVVTAPAITAEGIGPWEGIRRSASLMGRRYWPAVLVVFLTYLVETALRYSGLLLGLVTQLLPAPADWIGLALVNSAYGVVVQTAVVSVSVLLYLDARIRTEGLDLELRAADVLPARA